MPTAQVPQFINMESKIVGPLSLRQFLFLAGGGALIFVLNFVLSTGLWLIVSLFIAALAIALAFVKVNEQPLHKILLNAFKFMLAQNYIRGSALKKKRINRTTEANYFS